MVGVFRMAAVRVHHCAGDSCAPRRSIAGAAEVTHFVNSTEGKFTGRFASEISEKITFSLLACT